MFHSYRQISLLFVFNVFMCLILACIKNQIPHFKHVTMHIRVVCLLFQMFVQSISEHKPLVEKLNKTGEALIRLCNDEEGGKVQDILDADNTRYAALRSELRQRQQALEQALQVCSFQSNQGVCVEINS